MLTKNDFRHISHTYYIYKTYIYTCIVALMLMAVGCDRAGDAAPVKVGRLDLALREGKVPTEPDMAHAAEVLFQLSGYGQLNDSTAAVYAAMPSIRVHDAAMDSAWASTAQLEKELGRMRFNHSHLFPDKRFPAVYAVVSPFNQSVFTSDSLLYIGLNHYLGADYAPYSYFPDYIRKLKTPERVTPDVAEALVRSEYPYDPLVEYPTVLMRLLYEGAVVEAVMQLTGVSEQTALGYDDEQMKWLDKHEREVWESLIGRKLIFSGDEQLASQLVNRAPFTSAISPETPGGAGRFVGHRIVNSYLDRRARKAAELLSPEFYAGGDILPSSGYGPR